MLNDEHTLTDIRTPQISFKQDNRQFAEDICIMKHWEIVIIGGGPAGLMAGAHAAAKGRRTLLLEKNCKPGAKILISGGGRCNLTHACDARGILEALGNQGKFLHSALAACGPNETIEFFRKEGVPTCVESGTGKVFPQSNRAADVLSALLRRLKSAGCELATSEPLVDLDCSRDPSENGFCLTTSKRTLHAEKVLLATGGKSYPACGTTGDGFRFAEKLGHAIIPPRPALAPISTPDEAIRELQGITLPDVVAKVVERGAGCHPGRKKLPLGNLSSGTCLGSCRGALLFTHFGVSGPTAMNLSRLISGHPNPRTLILECDLLPHWNENALVESIGQACPAGGRKTASTLLDPWLPRRVAKIILQATAIPPERRLAELSKEDRRRIIHHLKHFSISVAGTLGFHKAEVTAGGVALAEVDSRTMQSKIRQNLYFSGELLDLDGPIGGYNLQIAFSTGFLAGESM